MHTLTLTLAFTHSFMCTDIHVHTSRQTNITTGTKLHAITITHVCVYIGLLFTYVHTYRRQCAQLFCVRVTFPLFPNRKVNKSIQKPQFNCSIPIKLHWVSKL